ncbi:hypothetical protein PDESU_01366 [Pontiella desulfatans]|uniref:Uncharacterized protein n=1 Tax=Pontiella desulfatans TaxID=2750659 RepID=A0A6C2TYT8_PONDE|nr:hypothetical protein [Pontiella desulfatans]VGO12812.1 hypothetical protein PDESU_01366 [Pontiella desulfatans]
MNPYCSKKTSVIVGVIIFLMGSLAAKAEVFRFDNKSPNGNRWMDGQNWRIQSAGDEKGQLPGAGDTVRFNYGGAVGSLSVDAGTISKLQIGVDDRGGMLALNPGAKLVVTDNENYIGRMGREEGGTLIVNGGNLNYKGWVSVANTGKGTFILNDGEVRVEDVFYHNLRMGGGAASTEIRAGLLDVNSMKLNSGTVDISGGIIRIRAGCTEEELNNWILNGLLTVNNSRQAIRDRDYSIHFWGSKGMEIRVPAEVDGTLQSVEETLGFLF